MNSAAPHKQSFSASRHYLRLQDRDLNFLEIIYYRRYATAQQLATMFPSDPTPLINPNGQFRFGASAIEKRITKLAQYNFINRLPNSIRRPQQPAVYTLGKEGVYILSRQRNYPYDELDKQYRYTRKYLGDKTSQNKNHFIEHELDITTFYFCLSNALKNHQAHWPLNENGLPLWLEPMPKDQLKITAQINNSDIPKVADSAIRKDAFKTKITRIPDTPFVLSIANHKIAYLLEIDKGTESQTHIAAKLLCYLHWFNQGSSEKRFATKQLRILFVVESKQRLDNMIQKAALPIRLVNGQPTGAGIFYFTTKDNISLEDPHRILKPIWTVGHSNQLQTPRSLCEV